MVAMKFSSKAQRKMDVLLEARRKSDRIHGLVEQYAGTTHGEDSFLSPISRTAAEVARLFMSNGYGIMADQANQIAMLAKRGVGKPTKLRTFREALVAVRQGIERAEKTVMDEDRAGRREGEAEAEPG